MTTTLRVSHRMFRPQAVTSIMVTNGPWSKDTRGWSSGAMSETIELLTNRLCGTSTAAGSRQHTEPQQRVCYWNPVGDCTISSTVLASGISCTSLVCKPPLHSNSDFRRLGAQLLQEGFIPISDLVESSASVLSASMKCILACWMVQTVTFRITEPEP